VALADEAAAVMRPLGRRGGGGEAMVIGDESSGLDGRTGRIASSLMVVATGHALLHRVVCMARTYSLVRFELASSCGVRRV
jgi:hypothetical protein